MKLICFSDLHAHKFKDFAKIDEVTGNSRLTNILNCLDQIREYAVNNGIRHILFGGDLFHVRGSVDTVTFNATFKKVKSFSDAGLKTLMIVGNHDQYSSETYPEHSLEAFKELPNVVVLDRFTPHKLGDSGEYVFPVPYSSDINLIKDKIKEYKGKVMSENISKAILLGHIGISGASVGKSSYVMQDAFSLDDLYPDVFKFGVFGHYHKYQKLGNLDHYFYTGSPIQHNFNDEGDVNGFVVVDLDRGTSELVPIDSPRFITVKDANYDGSVLKGNYVRFQVPEEYVETISSSVPEDLQHRIEPQKVYKDERRIDIEHSMSQEEVIRRYAKEFNPEAEDVLLDILKEVLSFETTKN